MNLLILLSFFLALTQYLPLLIDHQHYAQLTILSLELHLQDTYALEGLLAYGAAWYYRTKRALPLKEQLAPGQLVTVESGVKGICVTAHIQKKGGGTITAVRYLEPRNK